jgi:hypothetical protein
MRDAAVLLLLRSGPVKSRWQSWLAARPGLSLRLQVRPIQVRDVLPG